MAHTSSTDTLIFKLALATTMAPRKEHPPEIKHLCVSKWKSGLSHAAISRSLEIPVTSVKGIISRFKRNGHCANAPRSGRPRATDSRTDRLIIREVERNRFVGAALLAAQLEAKLGVSVHPQTVRNRIIDAGLNGRSARKTPFLTKQHRAKRLVYAKKLQRRFAEPDDWKHVLFTDEASVQLHGNTGKVSVWRRPHEAFQEKCTVPTFKSSRQSLMVWSSISAGGMGTMHFCEASVTGEYYRHLLKEEIPSQRSCSAFQSKSPLCTMEPQPIEQRILQQSCANLVLKTWDTLPKVLI